jgi:hypothetical protein
MLQSLKRTINYGKKPEINITKILQTFGECTTPTKSSLGVTPRLFASASTDLIKQQHTAHKYGLLTFTRTCLKILTSSKKLSRWWFMGRLTRQYFT